MDQESGPALNPAPQEPQPAPIDRRRALFAAAGERLYWIERYQQELNAIRATLEQEQFLPPPPLPAAEAPKEKETTQPSE
jgi:hypothetical protein